MNAPRMIEIEHDQLPMLLRVQGQHGQQQIYEIKPASKKFGAFLSRPSELLLGLLRKSN
jgi:hypothetical protein